MAKKRRNNTSETNNEDKQNVNLAEEKIVSKDDEKAEEKAGGAKQEIITEAHSECEKEGNGTHEIENAIDAAVKEYNGEIKEEKQIRIRDNADMARISKTNKKVLVITASVILALVISFIAIAVVNKMNSNVYRNIYVGTKNVTGMTQAELAEYLKEEQTKIGARTLKIYQKEEKILEVMPTDIDFEIDVAAVENKVFGFGRDSNILKNNIDILYALMCKKEFDLIYKYDVSKLSDIVKEIKESLDSKVIDDSYLVDENQYKLIITKGKSGNTIEEVEVKDKIISGLASGNGEYKLRIVTGKPEHLDVDVVYSEVKREATDAYIDKTLSVYKFVPHKVGLDFNKDDLKKVLLQNENMQEGKVIEYALTVIEPKVKTSDIKWEMYEYQVSSFTTHFSTADPNRVNNLRVALNLLNGKVIMPGEVFSYNSVVGAATAAQGFKAAATFVGGRVVNEVGGGICQTVSTLYNTALLANLEIVQRKAHSLPVAYVPPSRDATVYYPSIDFKFKNTREYPIKIVTNFNSGGSLTISLYGTKQENEYVVSISSKTLSTIKYKDQTIGDNTMEKGKQQIIQNGTNGYTSEAYITKKLNGKVVSTTLLSKDTYKAVNRIIKVGTKEVYVPPVPSMPENNTNTGNNNQNTVPEETPTVPDNSATTPENNTGTNE